MSNDLMKFKRTVWWKEEEQADLLLGNNNCVDDELATFHEQRNYWIIILWVIKRILVWKVIHEF